MNAGSALHFEAIPVASAGGTALAVELTPAPESWEVFRQVAHLPHLLFLDSAERNSDRGRYSYIAADVPLEVCTPIRNGRAKTRNTLAIIEEKLPAEQVPAIPGLPPFQGGIGGYFGYELGRSLEVLPHARFDEFQTPEWAIALYDWVISFDHLTKRAWIVSTGWGGLSTDGPDPQRARARLTAVLNLLRRPSHLLKPLAAPRLAPEKVVHPIDLSPRFPLPGFPRVSSNFTRSGYETAVKQVLDYIHAGDCFQVNLAQRLLAPLRENPIELYGRLRTMNPALFAGYFDLGDFQILSASPERFLQVSDGAVLTHPIKGTRPRGKTPEEDASQIRDLMDNPKDRSENIMIVDLLRNDLGKVCEFGSVRVPHVCRVETYRHVHHLVSEVSGKLRPGLSAIDLLQATFPGGSVTGAPKVRAMEIIAELEPTARGPYCGSLGWIGFNGAADINILIRTFTAGRGWVQFPVGGGIVAESDPAREYEETLHKAAGLLQALV